VHNFVKIIARDVYIKKSLIDTGGQPINIYGAASERSPKILLQRFGKMYSHPVYGAIFKGTIQFGLIYINPALGLSYGVYSTWIEPLILPTNTY